MKYIKRTLETAILKAVKQFPAVVLTGPRQTGKSTLLRHLFPNYNYITFDDISVRSIAVNDPALFVSTLKTPVILDEIQFVPNLLSYIKIHIDNKRVNGQFLMTGSQVFNVMQGISETLAGRIALFELLPLSFGELKQIPKEPADCFKQILKGFYPVPNTQETDISLFYGSYLSTYVERDVRQIKNIKDISSFQRFLELLASQAGNLLNIQSLASDCGISNHTAKEWLSILENSRIIYLLKPYFRNIGKRIIKSPKIYFSDTGLLVHLLRYKDADTLLAGPMAGAVFENMAVMEALKNKINKRLNEELYFYRDNNKVEIDLIRDKGEEFDLYEIKATQTIQTSFAKGLKVVNLGSKQTKKILSLNAQTLPLTADIMAEPWWILAE